MSYFSSADAFNKYLKEIHEYRKDYLQDMIEKYEKLPDPGYTIDLRTLTVLDCKDATFPEFGTLNNYYCKTARKIIKKAFKLHEESYVCPKKLSKYEDKNSYDTPILPSASKIEKTRPALRESKRRIVPLKLNENIKQKKQICTESIVSEGLINLPYIQKFIHEDDLSLTYSSSKILNNSNKTVQGKKVNCDISKGIVREKSVQKKRQISSEENSFVNNYPSDKGKNSLDTSNSKEYKCSIKSSLPSKRSENREKLVADNLNLSNWGSKNNVCKKLNAVDKVRMREIPSQSENVSSFERSYSLENSSILVKDLNVIANPINTRNIYSLHDTVVYQKNDESPGVVMSHNNETLYGNGIKETEDSLLLPSPLNSLSKEFIDPINLENYSAAPHKNRSPEKESLSNVHLTNSNSNNTPRSKKIDVGKERKINEIEERKKPARNSSNAEEIKEQNSFSLAVLQNKTKEEEKHLLPQRVTRSKRLLVTENISSKNLINFGVLYNEIPVDDIHTSSNRVSRILNDKNKTIPCEINYSDISNSKGKHNVQKRKRINIEENLCINECSSSKRKNSSLPLSISNTSSKEYKCGIKSLLSRQEEAQKKWVIDDLCISNLHSKTNVGKKLNVVSKLPVRKTPSQAENASSFKRCNLLQNSSIVVRDSSNNTVMMYIENLQCKVLLSRLDNRIVNDVLLGNNEISCSNRSLCNSNSKISSHTSIQV